MNINSTEYSSRTSNWQFFVSSLIALVILTAIGIATIVNVITGADTEREERVARTPDLPKNLATLRRFPGDFRFYAARRYAAKNYFIALNTLIKLNVFGHIPYQGILQGQDGFLFLGGNNAVTATQGKTPLDQATEAAWKLHFNTLASAFQKRSISFLFVIAPNKHSIYPEKLPDWLANSKSKYSRMSAILKISQSRLKLGSEDLRKYFADIRTGDPERLLYYKSDSHWNELGAALAINKVIEKIDLAGPEPIIRILKSKRGGDLSRMIGKQNYIRENIPELPQLDTLYCQMPNGTPLKLLSLDPLPRRRFRCTNPGAEPKKVLVFMDSFGVNAVPQISRIFQESVFVWQDVIDFELIDKIRPNIVIQILVERKLEDINPPNLLKQG